MPTVAKMRGSISENFSKVVTTTKAESAKLRKGVKTRPRKVQTSHWSLLPQAQTVQTSRWSLSLQA